MSAVETTNNTRPPFTHLIIIEPLGLLYGSSGRFLSPENLVGRSGTNFPPSAATLSGLFAASKDKDADIRDLMVAGPFWGDVDEVMSNKQNFYVPTPRNYLVKDGNIVDKLSWNKDCQAWINQEYETPKDKFESNTWFAINDWNNPKEIKKKPWKFLAHLHPRLEPEERHVLRNHQDQGSLFLENSVQMETGTCLVYLSNTELEPGWYRFGGEGHMVDVRCQLICSEINNFFKEPIRNSFALITPGVWGSNRLSKREPVYLEKRDKAFYEQEEPVPENKEQKVWEVEALFTDRPIPFRYRLGGKGDTKLLSRGRYAVPAGTVYVLKEPINQPWQDWNDKWFPQEGPSLKRWGCSLALPLANANNL
jgi:CRISPR-associated protein Cmr3